MRSRNQTSHFSVKPPAPAGKKVKGQAMVEFALAFTLFLVLVVGVIEFGHLLFSYISVYSATREAARYGASVGTNNAGVPHEKDCAGIRAAAVRVGSVVGVQSANISIRYDKGPTDTRTWANLPTCEAYPVTELGDRIIVQVSLTYKPLVGIIPQMLLQNSDSRTIIKSVDVTGDYPTAIPVIYSPTPLPTPTITMTPTVTSTATETPTVTTTPTATSTSTITLTPTVTYTVTPGPSPTPTYTPTRTPTSTQTVTPTPTVTPTATVPPCSLLGWDPPTWDPNAKKYTINLINNSFVDTISIIEINLNWTMNGNNKFLQQITLGGSTLWTGNADSSLLVGTPGSGSVIFFQNGANLQLSPFNTTGYKKALTFLFTDNMTMNSIEISVQIGDDPTNICIKKPV
jgi:hypothetical protein